ncbi:Serine acetyltransferase [Phycisphaerae bacterium RAS1]|nr:Serine acetyltransferase [Phycisphaerae bacterium RAS1]
MRHDLGKDLPTLVQRIVSSYHSEPRIQHIDREHLPARAAIVNVCDLLLELTYPGFVGRRGLTQHNIAFHVGELLPKLYELLVEQIAACLRHESEDVQGDSEAGAAGFEQSASDAAARFIQAIPDVRRMLSADVQAAYDGDPAATGTTEVVLAYPGVLAITIYRYAHELTRMDVPLMPRIMSEHAHHLTGIDIHPGASIGRSFFIDHGTAVVIGETSVIGDNVKIYQSVTLGALSFPKDARGRIIRGTKRHPTLGNGVTIYSNATVLGGDTTLGDGSVVGGSVFLTKSVEPGHMVSITPPILKVRPPQSAPKLADVPYVPTWEI